MGAVSKGEYDFLLKLLREHREAARISQRELARRLNKPQSVISKIESGTRRIDVIELFEFASECGFSALELLEQLSKQLEHNKLQRTANKSKTV